MYRATLRLRLQVATQATLSLLVLLLITSSSSSGAASSPGGSCSVPPDGGSTLRIIHAFGPCSPLRPAAPLPSSADFLSAQSARDDSRLLYLSSLAATAGRRSFQRRRLGPLLLLRRLPARLPSFSPAKSSTYRTVPCGSPACSQVPAPSCSPANSCSFNMSYGGSSLLAGLVQDSLSLAADVVPSYTFGCLQRVTGSSAPPQGLLGLGRGPLSFLSQTQNLYGGTFSYCLPSFKSLNFSGTLRLGPKGQPQRIKTTPLLANPHRPSLYYVNMTGVRVGRRVLPIPPSALAFDPATGAGTVVDAGTMFTRLAPPAYAALRDEFRRRVGAPLAPPLGGFDTCYNVSIAPAPAVTFLFDGAAVTLPEDNVLIHSTAGTITCLAMAAAPDGLNAVLNVIANMQQQNHRVLFDVPNARVGFAREMCT
uniref:Peptidase A1 domain-containing protein n=1 Tax=Ananas comosus var. bracteatus TaxID=296719 RepID=A0A6V7PRM2_ANACO|nr:unnamed protein product [Ananas comosus var. bracteatus]